MERYTESMASLCGRSETVLFRLGACLLTSLVVACVGAEAVNSEDSKSQNPSWRNQIAQSQIVQGSGTQSAGAQNAGSNSISPSVGSSSTTPSVGSGSTTPSTRSGSTMPPVGSSSISPSSGSTDSPYNRAVGLYGTKKFTEALVVLETGQIAPTQAANAAYYRALCYHQLGKTKEAAAAYRYVFSKYPQSIAARNAIKTLAKLDPAASVAALKTVESVKAGPIDWTNLPDQVSVPFRKGAGGALMVQAEMNGVPVIMMFDTGASTTALTETFLRENNITLKRTKYHGRAMGVGGEVSTNIAMADIRLGQIRRTIPLMVQDDRGQSKSQPALLGQSFYGDLPYSIDDSRGQIIFSKPAPELRVAGQGARVGAGGQKQVKVIKYADNEIPFRKVGNNLVVLVKVNGRECEMYFDTGASTVAFADRHLAACGLNRPTGAFAGGAGGVGGNREAFHFIIDSLKMANVERRDVHAAVLINANFDRPLLGQTFLTGLRYTIDPVRSVIRFE
ncbi:MAG: retroviral-like aspartic protease family protein [Candidatus Melainabacteria bacterium]|nr:retroviral-like aspartic protease family protein [Candidatus Melainabacteria bacterium]